MFISYSIMKDESELEILRDRQSFHYTYDDVTMDSLKKHFKLKDSLYVFAKQERQFAGFCSIDRGWWEENLFFIREILVDPKFQKQGIGEELMSKCVEHAKQKAAIGVVTETDFKNIPMQSLCTKLGFKQWDNPQWDKGITYKLIF